MVMDLLGLFAIRQYIKNPMNWQRDVAKSAWHALSKSKCQMLCTATYPE
jgi:hypothetical protein